MPKVVLKDGKTRTFAYSKKGMDAAKVLERAIEKKVAFVPGAAFHPTGGGENTMRLNFSYSDPDTIREGITRLGTTLKEVINETN